MERPDSFAGLGSDTKGAAPGYPSATAAVSDEPPRTISHVTGVNPSAAHRATSDRPSLWFRTGILLAWAVTLGFVSIATLRFAYHDGRHPLVWINAFTRYVYLPAYACLVLGLWKRRWWLALINAAVVGCHLYWVAPDFIRDRRFDALTAGIAADQASSAKLRIFFANVRYQNTEIDAFLSEIARVDPDVVILVEYSLPWREGFRQSSIMAKYPYGNGLKAWQMGDGAIFSRIPIQREMETQLTDRVVQAMDIPLGGQTLRVVGLHAPRPMNFHENDYDGFWKAAVPRILSEPHPLVVVGDCNATQYSLVYEQLKAGGLRSAHEDRGRGYATTWPNGSLPLPPIRIDQAFLSPEVACTRIAEGEGCGSDHKPLILDVEVGKPQ
jgi:endonuclease/exonuclease/phosphatase (EEP) superfamily protein YafD